MKRMEYGFRANFLHQTHHHRGNSIAPSSVTPKVTPKMSGWQRTLPIVSEHHFRLFESDTPVFPVF